MTATDAGTKATPVVSTIVVLDDVAADTEAIIAGLMFAIALAEPRK